MKNPSVVLAGALAATLVALPGAHAGVLLSNNSAQSDVIPAGTSRIATGATYSYIHDVAGNVRGNTDAAFINNDPLAAKLKDGYSELVGGSAAVYGSWSGGAGTGSGSGPFAANVATIVFDLKAIYTIESAAISARFETNTGYKQGLGTFEIWTSTNGTDYTKSGTWNDPSPVYQTTNTINRNAILNIALPDVEARYVMFYLSRGTDGTASHPTSTQMVVGELMIYGDAIPEPASLALLALGLPVLMGLRRNMVR